MLVFFFDYSIDFMSSYDLLLCILMSHSRNFIHEIKEFFHDEEQFVSSFVKDSREHYDYLLFFKQTATPSKKRLFDASVNHTVSGFVEEVITLLYKLPYVAVPNRNETLFHWVF